MRKIPLAFVFERFDFPGRRLLGGLVALPAVLPPLVGVIAFLFLCGESGIVARGLQDLLGLREAPWRLRGAGAILLVHAYAMYVYFYLFTRAGLARVDASLVEAAASLGAGRWRTLREVVLPLVRPQIAAAALLTFMTSLGSFSAPYVFGGGFRVMTTQIDSTKLNGDLGLAMVETTALAVLALIALALLRRIQGEAGVAVAAKGTAPGVRVLRSRGARTGAAALGWGLAVVLLLPHATLLLVSLVPLGTWTTEWLPPAYTLANFAALVHMETTGRLKKSLDLNIEKVKTVLVGFLRDECHHAGFTRGVLGLSGGVDSAVTAYLAAVALGRENLLGVMMPYRASSPRSRADAELVVQRPGHPFGNRRHIADGGCLRGEGRRG